MAYWTTNIFVTIGLKSIKQAHYTLHTCDILICLKIGVAGKNVEVPKRSHGSDFKESTPEFRTIDLRGISKFLFEKKRDKRSDLFDLFTISFFGNKEKGL